MTALIYSVTAKLLPALDYSQPHGILSDSEGAIQISRDNRTKKGKELGG